MEKEELLGMADDGAAAVTVILPNETLRIKFETNIFAGAFVPFSSSIIHNFNKSTALWSVFEIIIVCVDGILFMATVLLVYPYLQKLLCFCHIL